MSRQPTGDEDGQGDHFPDHFHTTIRVERVEGRQFRASQRGSDFEGFGETPHRAIADYAEVVEAGSLDKESVDSR